MLLTHGKRQAEEAARELQAFEADMARDSSKRGAFVRGEIINSSSAGKQQAPQPVATLSDFAMDDASPPPVADPAAGKKRRQLDELLEEMKRYVRDMLIKLLSGFLGNKRRARAKRPVASPPSPMTLATSLSPTSGWT